MSRTPSHLLAVLAAIAAATMIAACGSSSPSSSSSTGPLTASQLRHAEQDAVSFAGCMRSHGLRNFPDSPNDQKRLLSSSSGQAPAVQSAEGACSHFLAHGGQSQSPASTHTQVVDGVAFARCIRSHGFPSFPDPSSTGQLNHGMLANAGINLHQPAVVQAADACVGVTHHQSRRGPLRRRGVDRRAGPPTYARGRSWPERVALRVMDSHSMYCRLLQPRSSTRSRYVDSLDRA
jgi:hypothetical protein